MHDSIYPPLAANGNEIDFLVMVVVMESHEEHLMLKDSHLEV